MKRIAVVFFSVVLALGLAESLPAQSKTVSIATLDFPPISDPKVPGCGFIGEVFRAVFEPYGYTVKISVYPWARGFALSKQGESVDAIFPSIHRKEREAWFIFPDPVISSGYVLITRRDTGIKTYKSLDEFKNITIGVLRKGVTGSVLDTADFKKDEGIDFEMNIRKLLKKRLDLITGEYMSIMNVIDTTFADQKEHLTIIEPPISTVDFYLMISRQSPHATEIFNDCNRGLATIKSNGTLERLKTKYNIRQVAQPDAAMDLNHASHRD